MSWTPERTELLRRYWAEGESASRIAFPPRRLRALQRRRAELGDRQGPPAEPCRPAEGVRLATPAAAEDRRSRRLEQG